MKLRTLLAGLAATALLALLAIPAQAAVPSLAIKCGMVIDKDTQLYLAKNLFCAGPGVRVVFPEGEDGRAPGVSVDLRGHTLYGNGVGGGITAFAYPGTASLQVVNGRVENFEVGVGGDNNTRVTNVKLVGNRYGFFCNGACSIDQSYFKNSSLVGLNVGGEASASVKHSTFSGNNAGASVGGTSRLDIQHSTFFKNGIGVQSNEARVSVSYSVFKKNGTGILVTTDNGGGCADLHKNKFIGNGKNLVGPTC